MRTYALILHAALLQTGTCFVSRFMPAKIRVGSVAQARSSTICMAYNKVFVAGGSKGVGRETVEQLRAAGKEVVALVRSDEAVTDLESLGAVCVKGDAFTYKDVEGAMDGCDAAITTLGGVTGEKRVDYDGNKNVVEAAGILGVTRLMLVTSIGCGDSKEAISSETYEVLKEALVAKEKVEGQLQKFYKFTTDYTIIRPGGLVSEPATGKAELTDDVTKSGMIRRADVASLVVRALDDADTVKKIYSAIDFSLPVGGEE